MAPGDPDTGESPYGTNFRDIMYTKSEWEKILKDTPHNRLESDLQ